jgi:hypothetical protein
MAVACWQMAGIVIARSFRYDAIEKSVKALPLFGDLTVRSWVNGLRCFGETYDFICKGQENGNGGGHLEPSSSVRAKTSIVGGHFNL